VVKERRSAPDVVWTAPQPHESVSRCRPGSGALLPSQVMEAVGGSHTITLCGTTRSPAIGRGLVEVYRLCESHDHHMVNDHFAYVKSIKYICETIKTHMWHGSCYSKQRANDQYAIIMPTIWHRSCKGKLFFDQGRLCLTTIKDHRILVP